MRHAKPIRLDTIGDVAIRIGTESINPSAEILFATALYLILEKGPVCRTDLQEILWPAITPTVRAHRFRQTLLKLKHSGFAVTTVRNLWISLDGQQIQTDYDYLLERHDDSVLDFHLRILPGYEPQFSESYREWLDFKRLTIESQLAQLALDLVNKHRSQANWDKVRRIAERLLELQPYNEEGIVALAEALALTGNRAQATDLLDRYLRDEAVHPTEQSHAIRAMKRRIAERLIQPGDYLAKDSLFVGRSDVMEEISACIANTTHGEGSAVLVFGDAGVGKSRVLFELAAIASVRGMVVLRHNCRPGDRQRPLSAFVDLVPRFRKLPGAIGCAPETLKYLDKLTQVRQVRDGFDAVDDSWDMTYARICQAVFDLLDAVSYESSILWILEDAHWLDAASARLVGDIASWGRDRTFMLALSSREQLVGFEAGNFMRPIRLKPLSCSSANELLDGLLKQYGREISPRYREWCVTVTEGNPYFLQELAAQWMETGTELAIPPSLTALINERLCRLDRDSLYLLQTVALMDQNSTIARVESVLDYDASQLLKSITTLEEAGLLITKRPNGLKDQADVVVPKHDLLAEAALAKLTPAAKSYLHHRVGTVLESEVGASASTALLWDCVQHWQRAGDAPHALQLVVACADHLMDVGLPYAASEAYEKALSFCTKDTDRLRVLPALAHAYYRSSAWQKVGEVVDELNRLRNPVGESATHDEFELMNLRADWRTLKWDQTLNRALICLTAPEADANHRAEAGVMALMLLDICCEYAAMADVFAQITALGDRSSLRPSLLLQARMVYNTARGNFPEALTAAGALVDEERRTGNIGDLIRALCNHGQTSRAAGDFEAAKASLMEALRISRANGIQPAAGRILPILANMALELGWNLEARQWYERLREEATKLDDRYLDLDVQGFGVRLALIDGDSKRAAKILSRSVMDWRTDPVPFRRTYQAALHVATELACSGRAELQTLQELKDSHLRSRTGYHQAFATYALFVGLKSVGRWSEGSKLLEGYLQNYRREPWPAPSHLLEQLEATLRSN